MGAASCPLVLEKLISLILPSDSLLIFPRTNSSAAELEGLEEQPSSVSKSITAKRFVTLVNNRRVNFSPPLVNPKQHNAVLETKRFCDPPTIIIKLEVSCASLLQATYPALRSNDLFGAAFAKEQAARDRAFLAEQLLDMN